MRKSVKGAKELWYRRDAAGYIWLPLRWQPAAAEQYPGSAYHNYSFCVLYDVSAPTWQIDGEALTSTGAPSGGRTAISSVLSTM